MKTLRVIARLRKVSVDEARQALADCLHAEDQATAAEKSADATIRREREAAAALDAGDGAVEAFAAWLPQGRRAQEAARQARLRSEANTGVARARLAAARGASVAADHMLATRQALAETEAGRREQATLDEIALRCRRRD